MANLYIPNLAQRESIIYYWGHVTSSSFTSTSTSTTPGDHTTDEYLLSSTFSQFTGVYTFRVVLHEWGTSQLPEAMTFIEDVITSFTNLNVLSIEGLNHFAGTTLPDFDFTNGTFERLIIGRNVTGDISRYVNDLNNIITIPNLKLPSTLTALDIV